MADYTLSTGLSRRAMLAGSVTAPAMAHPVFQALAALSEAAPFGSGPNADTELFRRIAAAEHLRNLYARARRQRDRIRAARYAREGFTSPHRHSMPSLDVDTYVHYSRFFHRYADAVREAVAVPAHTVAGIHAKLALGVIAARRGNARVYMYEDREWLEITLIDLGRLADPERHGDAERHRTPDPLVLA